MPEKSIERLVCGVKKVHGYLQPYMSPALQGEYVTYEDHLQALGEAEKREKDAIAHALQCQNLMHDSEEREMTERLRAEAAEQKLQALIQGLEAEVEALDSLVQVYAAGGDDDETAEALAQSSDRLQALLDQAPDYCTTCENTRRRDIYKEDGSHWSGPCLDCVDQAETAGES